MSRLPCSVCGAEVLVTIHQANGGLCGRCVKGERPCVFCGQRVYGALPDGSFVHGICRDRAETAAKKLHWKTDRDIDWDRVRAIYQRKLKALVNHVAGRSDAPPEARLLFYTELNGGWNFAVSRETSTGGLENYGDALPGWHEGPEGYENAFALLDHDLDDEEVTERINERFLTILTAEVELLADRNFGFPESTQVTWKVHD